MHKKVIKPNFLIIGAQKCGTTWLWDMLNQHPGTDLSPKKEIHFFSTSELYNKGNEWYYSHFRDLDPSKVIGEASTSYLYDYVTYSFNLKRALEINHSLPSIPELITKEFPGIKIFILLRDPVKRAISAYKHNVKMGFFSPFSGLKEMAEQRAKMRILELGYYARYIRLWKKFVPPERMRIYIFEEDVVKYPEETVSSAYCFLNLYANFKPNDVRIPRYKSMGFTRLSLDYYAGRLANLNNFAGKISNKIINGSIISPLWERLDGFLNTFLIREKDIDFLRSRYLPEKAELEDILGRNLDCWTYGDKK